MPSFNKSFFRLSYRTKSIIILFLMACGPMPFDYDEFKSFFSPESASNEAQFHPYNFTSQFLYDTTEYWDDEATSPPDQTENTKAWAKYAGVSEKIVTDELYPNEENKNTLGLSSALQQKGKTEASEYLILAKKIEAADGDYENTPKANSSEYADWLTDVEGRYSQSKDIFVKERLGYQAVKLADMMGNPQKSIELYQKMVEPLQAKTFISDWAHSRVAGAYMHAKDSTQAYYHFSQVFVTAPTRRKEAHLSLRIFLPRLKDEALKLCKTNAEKANVYAATAVLPFQDALPMLEEIRELDAKHPMLEFVMAREINKNEYFFFNNPESLQYDFWGLDSLKKVNMKTDAPGYFNKLLAFSLESAEKPELKQSPFWYTAAAYLTFIAKDYKKSHELIAKAKAIPTADKGIQDQIGMQELILAVTESPTVTPEMEQNVISFLERFARSDKFRTANNFNAACKIMAAKYLGLNAPDEFSEGQNGVASTTTASPKENESLGWLSGCFGKKEKAKEGTSQAKTLVTIASPENRAKAFILSILASSQLGYTAQRDGWVDVASFMSSTNMYAIEDSTSSATINYTLDFFNKSKPSDFDKRLVKITKLDNNYLYTVLGRRALSEHNYAKAADSWKHVSTSIWQDEPYKTYLDVNPFHLNGLGDANPKQRVTPLSFALRMAELQEKVNKNPNDYESWLLLGCGSYNMSYFGNSWILLRRGWSSVEETNENDDYYTSEKALHYFDKAMKTAPNAEYAAKACYLAATCQQIRYALASHALYDDDLYLLPEAEREKKEAEIKQTLSTLKKEKYSTYLNLLKTKYQQTNYENQLIQECSTYKDFLAGK